MMHGNIVVRSLSMHLETWRLQSVFVTHSSINARQDHGENPIDYIVIEEDYLADKRAPELLEIEKLLNEPLFSP
jgi:hypothetical protein